MDPLGIRLRNRYRKHHRRKRPCSRESIRSSIYRTCRASLALKIGTYSEIRTVVQAEETFVDVDTIHSVSTVTIITFAGKGRTVIL